MSLDGDDGVDDALWRLEAEADTLMDLGRPEAALAPLARAAALDPESIDTHLLRARALLALSRHDEAEQAARAAIALAPEESLAHRLLALAQLGRGADKAAKATALTAVGLDPDEARNYVVLAEALQATRDEAGALKAARHAIELSPEDSIGHDLEGRLYLAHEEMHRAEASFRRALALDPEDEGILNNLALVLAIQGRQDDAVAGIEAATRIDPADELVRTNVMLIARRHWAWLRGVGIACAIVGVIIAVIALATGEDIAASLVAAAVFALIGFGLFELAIHLACERLSGPTAQLLRDDRRARRLKPWRWDWTWIARLRPWWWLILERIPPPIALVLNIVAGVFVPLILLGVPFSAWRAWRWYRREYPGRGSWRAPE